MIFCHGLAERSVGNNKDGTGFLRSYSTTSQPQCESAKAAVFWRWVIQPNRVSLFLRMFASVLCQPT